MENLNIETVGYNQINDMGYYYNIFIPVHKTIQLLQLLKKLYNKNIIKIDTKFGQYLETEGLHKFFLKNNWDTLQYELTYHVFHYTRGLSFYFKDKQFSINPSIKGNCIILSIDKEIFKINTSKFTSIHYI